jgi:protein-S-isoprenylcysteine O-methyltransferase Ste14
MQAVSFQPWNAVFLIGFITYAWIRGVYSDRTKTNLLTSRRLFPGDRLLLVLVFLGNVFLPLFYLFTSWLVWADYRLPGWAPWCGVLVMVTALWLFWRSHADLGLNWSMHLELRQGHQLITSGVYKRIRHPMYAAIWLFGLAQALLLNNWLAGWAALVTFAPLYFVRTPREEQLMCESFGRAYREYVQTTGRLIPRPFRGTS